MDECTSYYVHEQKTQHSIKKVNEVHTYVAKVILTANIKKYHLITNIIVLKFCYQIH